MKLTTSLSLVKGIGPKMSNALDTAGFHTVEDLLTFLPRRYEDFSGATNIADLEPGNVVIKATCESINTRIVRRGMRVTTAVLSDNSGKVKAVWFNQPYRETQLKSGESFLFSGKFSLQYNQYQLTSPSVEQVSDNAIIDTDTIVPVYRQIKDIKVGSLRKALKQLKPLMEFVPETLPQTVISRQKLVSRSEALLALHFPKDKNDIDRGRERLAFEELFEMILAAQYNKQANAKLTGWKIPFDLPTIKKFVGALPFKLTNAQRRAAWQILQDFEHEHPMNRLLQGDVGSGKTVVAGLAALQVAQSGLQTAIMAPTEILATQHAETISALLEPFGVRVAVFTSSVKGKARRTLLEQLEQGNIDVIIGTHALIQRTVTYHKLGFVVIDEQHRFGVKQRQALLEKSPRMPHVLTMTATPIPRSLALTLYGELDISLLDELPPGRQPITTKIWSPASAPKLYAAIEQELSRGHQAYVICPLIDENPDNDKKSVETEYHVLKKFFPGRSIGLMHGKLKSDEKQAVMDDFTNGKLSILLSTTVIEVGVNIPNATVMLIQNADHFGLSQLHQLRGRVGRGSDKSYCYLMLSSHNKPSARLREIESSQDGFYLAEADLRLRGPGEIYGHSQHGALNLQIATLADTKLIARAQKEAVLFLQSEEDLAKYKHLAETVEHYQRLTTLN